MKENLKPQPVWGAGKWRHLVGYFSDIFSCVSSPLMNTVLRVLYKYLFLSKDKQRPVHWPPPTGMLPQFSVTPPTFHCCVLPVHSGWRIVVFGCCCCCYFYFYFFWLSLWFSGAGLCLPFGIDGSGHHVSIAFWLSVLSFFCDARLLDYGGSHNKIRVSTFMGFSGTFRFCITGFRQLVMIPRPQTPQRA